MKQTQGGARPGAGRKPIDDPKKQLTIYVRKSAIKAVGGPIKARCIATEAILSKSKKKDLVIQK